MTKIQLFQLIAIVALIIFVFISYQQGSRNDFIFFPIMLINLTLWVLRLRERRHLKDLSDEE